MTDQLIHLFWVAVTTLFIVSAAYSWFVAIIVRKALPGETAWVYGQLAIVSGSLGFMFSGETVVPLESIWVVIGIFLATAAISSVASVVEMGNQYNGDVASRIPLTQQWRMLRRGIHQKDQEEGQ
jgi:RsiW-degrading membrane proteinase PrsW (M82 family)